MTINTTGKYKGSGNQQKCLFAVLDLMGELVTIEIDAEGESSWVDVSMEQMRQFHAELGQMLGEPPKSENVPEQNDLSKMAIQLVDANARMEELRRVIELLTRPLERHPIGPSSIGEIDPSLAMKPAKPCAHEIVHEFVVPGLPMNKLEFCTGCESTRYYGSDGKWSPWRF